MKANVLVVDDDPIHQEFLVSVLALEGYQIDRVSNGEDAIALCRRRPPEVTLLDIQMPGMSGMEVLSVLRQEDIDTGVIMMTGFADIPKAVQAMQMGADNFLPKPVDLEYLQLQVRRTAEKVQLLRKDRALRQMVRLEGDLKLAGVSTGTHEVEKQLRMLARSPDATVLFLGESGSGKGYLARWLHCNGPRSEMPMVELNCASFSGTLLESELFGYERGAFTDAKSSKKGLFEVAQGGVVFLDEVGDLPLELQPKLLTFLEDKRFRRIGGLHEIQVDVQVFAATNRDLKARVDAGLFRKDLYYRLNVLPIEVPGLAGRPDDIVLLANHFYAEHCRKYGQSPSPLSAEVLEALIGYAWPGNVRELRNVIERAFILGGYSSIETRHLPSEFRKTHAPVAQGEARLVLETLEEVERRHILQMLQAAGGNIAEAAKILGIGRSTLFQKIKHYRYDTEGRS